MPGTPEIQEFTAHNTTPSEPRYQDQLSGHSSSRDRTAMRLPNLSLPPNLTFGPFPITSSQAFHLSPTRLTYALVNLRPLLPGHTLICPVRRSPRLHDLTDAETIDLFLTTKRISSMLERVFKADALNVAVQDGAEAGQSVNHVHVHVIPRRKGDVERGDEIYEQMDYGKDGNLGEAWEEYVRLQSQRQERNARAGRGEGEMKGGPDAEDKRIDRTVEEMSREAEWLRWEMGRQEEMEGMKTADTGDSSGEIP